MALTLTENYSLTYDSSNDARLDFFFHVVEGSSPSRTVEILEKSWEQSPLDTMKLIINCRDIRGGKGIRPQSLICLKWLYDHQFDNLMLNLPILKKFGCWKDYLNILMIALFHELPHDVDTIQRNKRFLYTHINRFDTKVIRSFPKEKRRELELIPSVCLQVERRYILDKNEDFEEDYSKIEKVCQIINDRNLEDGKKIAYKSVKKLFPKVNMDQVHYKFRTNKAKLKKLNEFRRIYFEKKYEEDEKFRAIYDKIVDIFVEQLVNDYDNFKENKSNELSLASKWLPNKRRYFDKYTFVLKPIAKKFFKAKPEALIGVTKDSDGKQVRLFSKICTEMRRKLNVPELPMSSKSWNHVDYKCVPSVAMLRYRDAFIRNDTERFKEFIENKSLKAGAVNPAELVNEVFKALNLDVDLMLQDLPEKIDDDKMIALKAIDNQWKSLVDDLRQKGSLMNSNTLAICDISGSMCDSRQKIRPIHGALGLSLFLTEIADDIWNGRIITFSETPSFHKIDMTKSLVYRCKDLLGSDCGMNTDLNKVFTLILEHAIENKLPEDKMPKILFIFTDMEFDCAVMEKTNFEYFKTQYDAAGYETPFVIFWNLKGDKTSRSTPVRCDENGVILLSGFSAQTFQFLFKVENLFELSPLAMLLRIINDPRYDCVKVIDNKQKPQI